VVNSSIKTNDKKQNGVKNKKLFQRDSYGDGTQSDLANVEGFTEQHYFGRCRFGDYIAHHFCDGLSCWHCSC